MCSSGRWDRKVIYKLVNNYYFYFLYFIDGIPINGHENAVEFIQKM